MLYWRSGLERVLIIKERKFSMVMVGGKVVKEYCVNEFLISVWDFRGK